MSRIIGLVALAAFVAQPPTPPGPGDPPKRVPDAETPKDATPHKDKEAPWSEPFFGLRIRLTAENGVRFQHGRSLPLVVELQNVGDGAVRLTDLHHDCRIDVKDENGD